MRKKFLAAALILALAAAFCPKIVPTAVAAEAPAKVITGGFTMDEVTTRDSENYVAPVIAADCVYYLNGAKVNPDLTVYHTVTKRGTVAEFYLDSDGSISVIKVYYYAVDRVDGGVATRTLADGTVQVNIPGVLPDYTDVDKVIGWQGLAEGDIVLFYITELDGGTRRYTIEKAEKIIGKVSSISKNGTLTINGKQYRASEQQQTDINISDIPPRKDDFIYWTYAGGNMVDDYTFYLDKNGSIVAITQMSDRLLCQGYLDSPSQRFISYSCTKDGDVVVHNGIPENEMVLVACYDDDGHFTGAKLLDSQTLEAHLGTDHSKFKLCWLGSDLAPQCGAKEVALTSQTP